MLPVERRQALPQRVQRCLHAIGELQLVHDVAEMCPHRRFADVQLLGDFVVVQALRDEAQHLHFTFGQWLGS